MSRAAFSIVLALVLLACGDDDGGDPQTADTATSDGATSDGDGATTSDGSAGDGSVADPTAGLLDVFGISMGCDVAGSPFSQTGTGIIRGTGTLPADIELDLQLNLMIGAGGARYGVLAENIFDITSVCDITFNYEITLVQAGEWQLYVEIRDPSEPDDELSVVYEAEGDVSISIADGETVEQDLSFETPL